LRYGPDQTIDIATQAGQICSRHSLSDRGSSQMIAFLYSLPDLGVAILFGCTAAALFVAAPLLRLAVFGPVSDANSEIARATLVTITGFTGAVLAFSLVQAQGNLRSVEKTVSSEATQLNQLDRLLIRYGDPKVAAIREPLRIYAESLVKDEWPELTRHSSSQRSAELFGALSQSILAVQPSPGRESVIFADMVKITDQLAESRQDRLNETDLGLPPIFWEVIGSLMLLLVGFAAFVEPQRGRTMSLGGLGAGLALLVTLVFIFDQPFLGTVSVTPDAIIKAIAEMRARIS
jgi:hypothetical protein